MKQTIRYYMKEPFLTYSDDGKISSQKHNGDPIKIRSSFQYPVYVDILEDSKTLDNLSDREVIFFQISKKVRLHFVDGTLLVCRVLYELIGIRDPEDQLYDGRFNSDK